MYCKYEIPTEDNPIKEKSKYPGLHSSWNTWVSVSDEDMQMIFNNFNMYNNAQDFRVVNWEVQ